jgi:hypothetical protein
VTGHARWFANCIGAGFCIGVGALAVGAGEWLVAPFFLIAGGFYTSRALRAAR